MAGIYLHIPFCKQACHYCDFHFSTSQHYREAVVRAMCLELVRYVPEFGKHPIRTVYFGGGTPSLLPPDDIALLLQTVRQHYHVADDAEITLEANPDDLTPPRLTDWQQAGINRLSIGVQSWHAPDLLYMNRAHTAEEAAEALRLALEAGFRQLSIDLIYGTPTLSHKQWLQHLHRVAEWQVPHLSCYALTVEPNTPLHKQIRTRRAHAPTDQHAAHQMRLLQQWAAEHGYEHYEISNLALPGQYSRHNTAYWQGKPYLGIGPSAHSFDGLCTRWSNYRNNQRYFRAIEQGQYPVAERETLTPTQHYHEYVLTSIRTQWGCHTHILQQWGKHKWVAQQIAPYVQRNWVQHLEQPSRYVLTPEGQLYANQITEALFCV